MSSTSSIYYIDYFNILGVHSSCDQNCEGGAHTQGRYVGSSEIEVCPSFGNERKDWHSSEGLILKLSFYFSTSFIKKNNFYKRGDVSKSSWKSRFFVMQGEKGNYKVDYYDGTDDKGNNGSQ